MAHKNFFEDIILKDLVTDFINRRKYFKCCLLETDRNQCRSFIAIALFIEQVYI